jgi:altronate hydrolase
MCCEKEVIMSDAIHHNLVRINPGDNVSVAVKPIQAGTVIAGLTALQSIPQGHKVALMPIARGEKIIKYGYPIGVATRDIPMGQWVHTHNVRTGLSEQEVYRYKPCYDPLRPTNAATFEGYMRDDGRAGVRNEIWILPTVGCVNDVCKKLAAEWEEPAKAAGLDGVFAFPHPYGCSQMGQDHTDTRKILAALARHPNAGGVLMVGLGCENLTMEQFQAELGRWNESRTKFMICRQEEDELATGHRLLRQLVDAASTDTRTALPAAKLVVGVKCGGSDGLSGITANAVAGAFSDRLIAMGGSTILTEVPEMFGAEQVLMGRCINEDVFIKMVDMVSGFKDYFVAHGQVVYENPSPGNKDGGITTLEDKSLGCVQKGGAAPVVDVLEYGSAVQIPGLNLLSGPGNDLVSTTALTAAGAQIILFTTGRGTPFGAPAVTLKIASNSELAHEKQNWIDFDAGTVVAGESIASAAERMLADVLAVASGQKRSRAEENGYREIAIFKNGVTL